MGNRTMSTSTKWVLAGAAVAAGVAFPRILQSILLRFTGTVVRNESPHR